MTLWSVVVIHLTTVDPGASRWVARVDSAVRCMVPLSTTALMVNP